MVSILWLHVRGRIVSDNLCSQITPSLESQVYGGVIASTVTVKKTNCYLGWWDDLMCQ